MKTPHDHIVVTASIVYHVLMSLDESQFLHEAEHTLTHLFDELESAEGAFDIDAEEGDTITITLDEGGVYIISKHTASQQLWLSSPHSGASHYEYHLSEESEHPADNWRNTRATDDDAQTLKTTLFDELKQYASAVL